MNRTTIILVVMLFLSWGLQSFLSILQTKKVFKRIKELRALGRVGIGASGTIYKRRVYTLLAVDQNDIVTNAEVLSGWTVFAKLKPIDGLKGISLHDLVENSEGNHSITKKEFEALKVAANYLLQKEQDQSVNIEEQEVEY